MRSSGTLLCLASAAAFGAMAVLGKLAYDDGATVGTLLAVRFLLAAALFWALVLAGGAARELRALGGRDLGIGLALGGVRLRDPGRLLLRRARAHRRVAALAAPLHLPGDGGRGGVRPRPRARSTARRLAALALASGGLVLVVAGAGAGRARPARRGARARRRGGLQHLHPRERGHRRRGCGRACSRRSCARARRRSLTAGSALLGELRPGELTAAGWGWLACLALVSTVAAIEPLLRRPAARGADQRLDPLHRRARGDRAARLPRLRRAARRGAARSAAPSCSAAVLMLASYASRGR